MKIKKKDFFCLIDRENKKSLFNPKYDLAMPNSLSFVSFQIKTVTWLIVFALLHSWDIRANLISTY